MTSKILDKRESTEGGRADHQSPFNRHDRTLDRPEQREFARVGANDSVQWSLKYLVFEERITKLSL